MSPHAPGSATLSAGKVLLLLLLLSLGMPQKAPAQTAPKPGAATPGSTTSTTVPPPAHKPAPVPPLSPAPAAAPRATTPVGSAAAKPPVKPEPEAALTLPALARRDEALFIVQRTKLPGMLQKQGYDTLVLAGTLSGSGKGISSIAVSERRIEGLVPVRVYRVVDEGESRNLVMASGDMSVDIATIAGGQASVEIRSEEWIRTYQRSSKGGLTVKTEAGGRSVLEEWRSAGKDAFRLGEGTQSSIAGGYSLPEKGRVVYTEQRLDQEGNTVAITAGIWLEGDELRFRTEGPGLASEVYAFGLGSLLTSEAALENLALVDTVLGHELRSLPAMAWMLMRYKPPR